jgi:hypothetical protein
LLHSRLPPIAATSALATAVFLGVRVGFVIECVMPHPPGIGLMALAPLSDLPRFARAVAGAAYRL